MARCTRDGNLAGSALTMDRAVRNVMKFAGLDLQQAVRAASMNPAKVVGIKKGTIEPGADADFVVLTPAGRSPSYGHKRLWWSSNNLKEQRCQTKADFRITCSRKFSSSLKRSKRRLLLACRAKPLR